LTISSDNKSVEAELSRTLTKQNFEKMKIIGQFNRGFIITKLGSDLFIIDQHASDEKYNYETLQKTTKLNLQRLLKPLSLELSAVDEMIVIDNLDVFRANGFDFDVNKDEPPTQRIKLTAYPFSKNTEFGIQDVMELIFLLRECPGKMVRLSRVSSMFASRACRKSIMIGKDLNKDQMHKIVKNMGKIDNPWACPHGRPTLRHLVDLNFLPKSKKKDKKSAGNFPDWADWDAFDDTVKKTKKRREPPDIFLTQGNRKRSRL